MKQFLIIISILLSSAVFGQEELRYENRQFYQGKKEITYNQFYEIIKLTDYKVWFTDGRTLKREPIKGYLQATALTLAGSVAGLAIGVNYDKNNASAGEYTFRWFMGTAIGCAVGMSTGIVAVIKHIPGHGCAVSDSHFKTPKVNLNYNKLNSNDFFPFKSTSAKLAMTAHVLYKKIDSINVATFSKKIIKEIIRKNLKNSKNIVEAQNQLLLHLR